MDVEDSRDTREARGTNALSERIYRRLQTPWLAVCVIGLLLLLYLGDVESLQRSSLQLKAVGKMALEHAALQWRGHSATRKLIPGLFGDPTTKTEELVASPHLRRLRDRLRPLKVGALVFYGRRRYAKLLNTYLERNLASNGGILDEVVFAVRTDDEGDLEFLEALLLQHPGVYRRSPGTSIRPFRTPTGPHWQESYLITRSNRIYVKIDDDIVFIQDGAVEAVVEEKLRGRYLFVSANVVNHPLLSHVHAQFGALLPFQPPSDSLNSSNSHKPFVVTNNATVLDDSPARTGRYGAADPCWWADWRCGAIAHYSFLHHLRAGSLDVYDFSTWDLSYPEYQRWSINLFAFNSSDLTGPLISDEKDDEAYISQLLPAYRKQHAAAVGRSAVVVHFAYYTQEQGLLHNASGLLNEYHRVADLYTSSAVLHKEKEG